MPLEAPVIAITFPAIAGDCVTWPDPGAGRGSRPCDNWPSLRPMDPDRKRKIRLGVALGTAVVLAASLVYVSFSSSSEAKSPSQVLAAGPGSSHQVTVQVRRRGGGRPRARGDRRAVIPTLGAACLGCAFLCALYAAWAALAGRHGDRRYTESARLAVYAMAGLLTVCVLCLEVSFLRDDFSVELVADHSSTTTPTGYKLTAMWSSQ